MANQFLALALFVMLLSFFIILNSMSNFEVIKAREVLTSLSVAFSKENVPNDLSASVKPDPVESAAKGNTLDQLKELFETQIAGVEVQKNRLGTTMHMRIPVDKFEAQISGADGRAAGNLTPTLVSLLLAEDQVAYSLEIILNLTQNPAALQGDTPQDSIKNIKRVSGYAKTIEDIGLPKKFISAGLGKGPEKTVDLFFKRYQPFNPLGARGE